MNNLQKACLVLILITVIGGSGISAQDEKNIPNKEHTPKFKVEKEKNDNKQPDKNRDNNKNRDNDKGNKKPGI